jgi:hypothetical protein
VEPAANPLETSVNLKGVLELLLKSAVLRDMEQVGVAVVGVTVVLIQDSPDRVNPELHFASLKEVHDLPQR